MKEKTGIYIFVLLPVVGVLLGLSEVDGGSMHLSLAVSCVILVALVFRWFRHDTISRGHKDLIDRGLFLLTAGHIILPLYVIWTRRFKGILILLLAVLSLAIPSAVIAILFR